MESLVPQNHVLRRLNSALNLSFVRVQVASLYSGIGRPSVDPEVVVRLWILQHFFGYSERQVCEETRMHAGMRWFCGLSFNDAVPEHSTLVKLRTTKWAETHMWQSLLAETVRACEAAGLCRPSRMGCDGTMILANAAVSSLEEIPPTLRVDEAKERVVMTSDSHPPVDSPPSVPELRIEEGGNPQGGQEGRGRRRSGPPVRSGETFSNETHRSTTDPQSRLYRRSLDQEAKLRLLGHYMADLETGVIYGAMGTVANGMAERQAALAMLDTLAVKPRELVMDKGYRDGEFLAEVYDRGVTPLVALGHLPVQPEPTYKNRACNPRLALKRAKLAAEIRARNAVRQSASTPYGRRAQSQRWKIERLYAEAKNEHGLRRAHGRGLTRLDQQIKLTAAVQNLRRLMSYRPWRRASAMAAAAQALQIDRANRIFGSHWRAISTPQSTKGAH